MRKVETFDYENIQHVFHFYQNAQKIICLYMIFRQMNMRYQQGQQRHLCSRSQSLIMQQRS